MSQLCQPHSVPQYFVALPEQEEKLVTPRGPVTLVQEQLSLSVRAVLCKNSVSQIDLSEYFYPLAS